MSCAADCCWMHPLSSGCQLPHQSATAAGVMRASATALGVPIPDLENTCGLTHLAPGAACLRRHRRHPWHGVCRPGSLVRRCGKDATANPIRHDPHLVDSAPLPRPCCASGCRPPCRSAGRGGLQVVDGRPGLVDRHRTAAHRSLVLRQCDRAGTSIPVRRTTRMRRSRADPGWQHGAAHIDIDHAGRPACCRDDHRPVTPSAWHRA